MSDLRKRVEALPDYGQEKVMFLLEWLEDIQATTKNPRDVEILTNRIETGIKYWGDE